MTILLGVVSVDDEDNRWPGDRIGPEKRRCRHSVRGFSHDPVRKKKKNAGCSIVCHKYTRTRCYVIYNNKLLPARRRFIRKSIRLEYRPARQLNVGYVEQCAKSARRIIVKVKRLRPSKTKVSVRGTRTGHGNPVRLYELNFDTEINVNKVVRWPMA